MTDGNSMFTQLKRAMERRTLLRTGDTDLLRIVDGAADGFPGIEIDDFAGRWLVQTLEKELPEWMGNLPCRSVYWKRLGEKVSPQFIAGHREPGPFEGRENGVRYWIDFDAGYSQGIFLDQRENRALLRDLAKGKTVLNCFAYTCGFGVSAAMGGGETVNLDLSKRYLDWGCRNYELNGIDPQKHDFIYGDVFDWMKRLGKKGRRFDFVILDPPTFSRNTCGKVFRIAKDLRTLIALAVTVLNPGGQIFCSTNQRSLSDTDFLCLIKQGLEVSRRRWLFKNGTMPEDFCGDQYLKSMWIIDEG